MVKGKVALLRRPLAMAFASASTALVVMAASAPAAMADLKLCNRTDSKVGVALGYKDIQQGWTSEGWWNVAPSNCVKLKEGPLNARYYYVYAVDYDKGGAWGGASNMCTQNKLFTIRGLDSCQERGFDRKGFFEVDTGEEMDWTVELSGAKTTQ
jgi:uncharacterized membrane protein